MKAKNIKINTEIIAALNPCNDRFDNWKARHPKFNGTILEFLELDNITVNDKIWVSVRVLPREIVEVFAVDCAFSASQYAAAYAIDAIDAAAYAAASAATYAAASAATYAASATYAAYAAYAASAAYADVERQNQVDAIIFLINHEDKLC